MADITDLLHLNDIAVVSTLGPDDNLLDWTDTRLLARIFDNGEFSDKTAESLPVVCKRAETIAWWELGGLRVPVKRLPVALVITKENGYEIIRINVNRRSNGSWDFEDAEHQEIRHNFRIQTTLYHAPSLLHRRYMAKYHNTFSFDIEYNQPLDEILPDWLVEFLPAETLLDIGTRHYGRFQCGDKSHLKLTRTSFERALEALDIDPDLSRILETIIPFLYCLEQGGDSCLEIAFEVFQTLSGLPNTQVDAQVLLLDIIYDAATSVQWQDYFPLAVKLTTRHLQDILLHSAPSDVRLLRKLSQWAYSAYSLIPDAKEVLPLMDLAVDLLPGAGVVLPSGDFISYAMLRALVYFQQAVNPGGPGLNATLEAAEFVMYSSAIGFGPSQKPISALPWARKFAPFSHQWLHWTEINRERFGGLVAFNDRLLRLIAWQLSNLPFDNSTRRALRGLQYTLKGGPITYHSAQYINAMLEQPGILDDNDDRFIGNSFKDLCLDERIREGIPVEYPNGAAQLVRNIIREAESAPANPFMWALVAIIARTLDLPEVFKVYELLMCSLQTENGGTFILCFDQLKGAPGLSSSVRDAISCASDLGQYALALQWSDQGRTKIWDWFFHSRLFVDQVQTTDPLVARKLKTRPQWIDSWTGSYELEKFDNIESLIRDVECGPLPGFDRFLQPKTSAEIMSIAEALGGPIVYLNPNRYSSHALVVLPGLDDVVHIPLPHLDYPALRALSVDFMKSPRSFLREDFSAERKGHMVKPKQIPQPAKPRFTATELLEQLWMAVVKPVLDGLGIQRAQTRTSDLPRIWWCPSGPLSGLPIHAAGIYSEGGQGPTISDYAVSSYFPSASALAYATRPEDPSQKFSLLTIANPAGAGLPGTEWELEKIKMHTMTQELTRGEATVEAVKEGMEKASWVHFACHGVAKPDRPMDSALILANHMHLTLREISDLSLPHAEFAYLSACQTATEVTRAPDQSAHLSTGMMACGYRSIVGTMWQISDEHAPFVADRVYAKMVEGGRPDYKRAAYALHDAVQALRKERQVGFETWVPFIHIGV